MSEPDASPVKQKKFRWTFPRSFAAVLAIMVAGEAIGSLLSVHPFWIATMRGIGAGHNAQPQAMELVTTRGVFGAMAARDWIFIGFLLSAGVWAFTQRAALVRFLRSMTTGVAIVSIGMLAVIAGVLVPQIEGFEDPHERVTEETYEYQYEAFAFAEGYFLYHMLHLYGVGMPETALPEPALQGLERYAELYGREEADNRRKLMDASFGSGAKQSEIYAFIDRHDAALRKAFDVCIALDLNRAYKAHWFVALGWLLFAAVLSNTFRYGWKRTFSVQKIGFFTVHVGILTMLSGLLVSRLFTDRGLLDLTLGDPPADTYYRHYRTDRLAKLPFGVGLDHFGRQDWKQIAVEFPDQDLTSRAPEYTLWPGRVIELDWRDDEYGRRPNLRIECLDTADHVSVGLPFIRENYDSSKPNEILPVAELDALQQGGHGEDEASFYDDPEAHLDHMERGRLLLSPFGRERTYEDPGRAYRLQVSFSEDNSDAAKELFPPKLVGPGAFIGTIELGVDGLGTGELIQQELHLGETFELDGGWSVRVSRATRNFRLDPATGEEIVDVRRLEEQPLGRPAVWLEITPPEGHPTGVETKERMHLDGVDWRQFPGIEGTLAYKQVHAVVHWDAWAAPGAPRFVLNWNRAGEATLLDDGGNRTDIVPGGELPLPGTEPLILRQLVVAAEFDKNVEFLPERIRADGWDEGFYMRDARGAVMRIVQAPGTPQETSEELEFANASLYSGWRSDDGRYQVVFFENDAMMPFEWRSVLSIYEQDADGRPYKVDLGTERAREIRVNDYFMYNGYRFFQTDANPKRPWYSGIGVVYDPGIEPVLVGMYTIILGTLLAFIVRPIVEARRSRQRSAA